MATHLKIVLLPCLLVFMVLMEDVKPVLAKQGERLKQRTKILEDTVRELNERIKALEECEACSKIKGRNETSSESQEKIDSKPECQNYTSLISADRKITFSVYASSKCDDKLVPAWYRFQGAAGTRMPTSCPPDWRCGTVATGWLNGEHPSVAEGKVTRQVCFHMNSDCCVNSNWEWSNYIQVRNCGSFYVYYLSNTPGCHFRYCSTD
ncbi:pancreatic secretory granule membrane major glycoprotein GP2-like [Oculina patagonica]